MTNLEKYEEAFVNALDLSSKDGLQDLKYQGIEAWDSVGHMTLVSEIEDAFDIEMETDDIVDFNSFQRGKELLAKYDIVIE